MATPKTLIDAEGKWYGESVLNLSHLPENERIRPSDSSLTIQVEPRQTYAKVDYVWNEDGPQSGALLICGQASSGIVTGAWADAWHQSSAAMHLTGDGMEGVVRLSGEYEPTGYPKWGWRLEFELAEDKLLFRMFNISPEGEEEWAVRAEYSRG